MNTYIITISDVHEQDGEKLSSEFTTACRIIGGENDYSVIYKENGQDMTGCVTTVSVKDKSRVEITRRGDYSTRLIMEKDVRHTCFYDTPFGSFTIGVYANEVQSDMKKSGGTLKLKYTLDFNSGLASLNEMTIKIKEAGKNVDAC